MNGTLGTRALTQDGGSPDLVGDEVVFGKKHRTDNLLGEFREYLIAELGRAPRTADSYEHSLRSLGQWLEKPIAKVTSDDVRRFKREAVGSYAPNTIQHFIVAIHQFHRWGALEGYWQLNGIAAVATPRVPYVPHAPVGFEVARDLEKSCRLPYEFRLVYLGLYAGLRVSESQSVTAKEWQGDRITIIGKGTKQRTIPVHRRLGEMREVILRKQPKSRPVLQSVMERLRERTGAVDTSGKPVTTHALRRTFADALYDKFGVPQEVVGAILGHGKGVTELYAPVRFDKMREAVSLLDYSYGEPVQLALF